MTFTDTPIPAATVVIVRDRPGDVPELLMVERSRVMAFAGGASVFPGGRVDPGDRALAGAMDLPDPDEGAHRIAAIRETLEEAGVALAMTPQPTAATAARMRAELHGRMPIAAVLARAGCVIDIDLLVPLARWRPSHAVARVFDTRFYLARWPVSASVPEVDGTENVRIWWTSAADALAAAQRGTASLIFPTRRNLERLALHADLDAMVADARAHPVTTIVPVITQIDGVAHVCVPEGLGYPLLCEPVTTAGRG